MIIDTLELVKQHLMKHEEITLSRYEYTAIRKEIEESVKQSASPTNTAITKCADDILKLDCADEVINKYGCLVVILKRHFA